MDWWNEVETVAAAITNDAIELLKIAISWPGVALIAIITFQAEIARSAGRVLASVSRVNLLKGEIEFAPTRIGDIANSASPVTFNVNHFILVNNDFGFKMSYRRYSGDDNFTIEVSNDEQLENSSLALGQKIYAAIYWKNKIARKNDAITFNANINVIIQGGSFDSNRNLITTSNIESYNAATKLSVEARGGELLTFRCNSEDNSAVYEAKMPIRVKHDDDKVLINLYTTQRVIIYKGLAYLATATTSSVDDVSDIVKKEMTESINSFEVIQHKV